MTERGCCTGIQKEAFPLRIATAPTDSTHTYTHTHITRHWGLGFTQLITKETTPSGGACADEIGRGRGERERNRERELQLYVQQSPRFHYKQSFEVSTGLHGGALRGTLVLERPC